MQHWCASKQWNYYDPNSDINIAMQQAFSAGIYNTEGMYNDVDSQGLMEVLPQEFAFWFIVTAWDYIEKYFPNNENEWNLKSSIELKEKLPLAYKLYEETVLPVITKPSESFLDSLAFSYSSNTDQVIDNSSGEDLSLSQTTIILNLSPTSEEIVASGTRVNLSISSEYSLFTVIKPSQIGGSWQISSSEIGTDTLTGFKRLEFNDGVLALDIDAGDTAGQAYRLYQAAFARTPDMPGVSYHMNDMESNGLVLENIANNFIASPEFKTKYGDSPSDDEFIDLLYQNVLGRSADDDGLAFYTNHFNEGTMTRAAALIGFAESPENISLVAPQIEDGIWLAS